MCKIAGVSRSGYYKWLNHQPTDSEELNGELIKLVQELFNKHKGILGYRRMTIFINRKLGTNYNKKRIRRLMLILDLKSFIRRARHSCTRTSYKNIEDNILNRDFSALHPNEKWCTDVTYLQYGLGGKAYLSAIKDLYDGSIVAYEIGHNNDNPLVMNTIKKALKSNPGAKPLLHSDRGSQYTSREYRYVTTKNGIRRSMSRVGKCIDNAPIESFWSHFKTESYSLKKYLTFEELVRDVETYIEFYNSQRYQSKLNNLTPYEFRNQAVA